jgi:hypothetical protein
LVCCSQLAQARRHVKRAFFDLLTQRFVTPFMAFYNDDGGGGGAEHRSTSWPEDEWVPSDKAQWKDVSGSTPSRCAHSRTHFSQIFPLSKVQPHAPPAMQAVVGDIKLLWNPRDPVFRHAHARLTKGGAPEAQHAGDDASSDERVEAALSGTRVLERFFGVWRSRHSSDLDTVRLHIRRHAVEMLKHIARPPSSHARLHRTDAAETAPAPPTAPQVGDVQREADRQTLLQQRILQSLQLDDPLREAQAQVASPSLHG